MGSIFPVSRHAQKRMKERNGLTKKAAERIAKRAFEEGLRREECAGRLRKWMDNQHYYGTKLDEEVMTEIRIFGDKTYIYDLQTHMLVTVIQVPSNLMYLVQKYKRIKFESDL